jgi:hypothetical protein
VSVFRGAPGRAVRPLPAGGHQFGIPLVPGVGQFFHHFGIIGGDVGLFTDVFCQVVELALARPSSSPPPRLSGSRNGLLRNFSISVWSRRPVLGQKRQKVDAVQFFLIRQGDAGGGQRGRMDVERDHRPTVDLERSPRPGKSSVSCCVAGLSLQSETGSAGSFLAMRELTYTKVVRGTSARLGSVSRWRDGFVGRPIEGQLGQAGRLVEK